MPQETETPKVAAEQQLVGDQVAETRLDSEPELKQAMPAKAAELAVAHG